MLCCSNADFLCVNVYIERENRIESFGLVFFPNTGCRMYPVTTDHASDVAVFFLTPLNRNTGGGISVNDSG